MRRKEEIFIGDLVYKGMKSFGIITGINADQQELLQVRIYWMDWNTTRYTSQYLAAIMKERAQENIRE